MIKSKLRSKYKALRQELSQDSTEDLSIAIANQVLKLNIWEQDFYHIFLPIEEQREVNTEYILNILNGKDKHIVISRTDFKTLSMQHVLLMDNTVIKKNNYNIPEPVDGIPIVSSQINVVFVPLLAFDTFGNRVGYGKGFYDKFLSECKPETIKIGLSFFEPVPKIEDISKTDVKLDYCVTPREVYQF